ncbi:hypothetical protein NT6N_22580 [Oceaniferula spumae]|uniref:Ice-binding protein C-terminal domain-containing protein n=1 Tax=Oceaniferula spumae TaxID=2979115 RepID=A0AAT9FMN7_9BACT
MKTKKLLTGLALAASLTGAANAAIVVGDVIGIDFGSTPYAGGGNFNDFGHPNIANGASSAFVGTLVNLDGNDVTGVGFSVGNFSGDNTADALISNGSAGSAPFDESSIYVDALISNDSNGTGNLDPGGYLTLTFTGLDDSLTYNLNGGFDGTNANFNTTWSFDSGSAGISTTQNDSISSFLAASGDGYHIREGLQTDGSGNLVIQLTRTNHVNVGGLTLSAVPEPSTTALLGFGGFALILRRRK